MSQPPNLTREQAQQRARAVSVQSYDVTLDLTDGAGGPGEKELHAPPTSDRASL